MNNLLHIIPAAGKADRIGGIPKFLLPIGSNNFLIKFHVQNLLSELENCKKVIAVNSENYETVKRMDLNAEILTVDTSSMNETVNIVISKYPEYENYLLTMPDTYYRDHKIIDDLVEYYFDSKSLISTALWKIQNHQIGNLGQVSVSSDYIVDVVDKDSSCKYKLCWGSIIWHKDLNKYILNEQSHVGYMLKPIINSGHKISFKKAEDVYYDCGTFEEYSLLIRSLN